MHLEKKIFMVLSYKSNLELYEQMENTDSVMKYINNQICLSLRF